MPFIENQSEFLQRTSLGLPPVTIREDNSKVLLTASGAKVVYDLMKMNQPTMLEAPAAGSREELRAKKKYHQTRLDLIQSTFESVKLLMLDRWPYALNTSEPFPPWVKLFGERVKMPEEIPLSPKPEALTMIKELAGPHREALLEIDNALAIHADTLREQEHKEATEKWQTEVRQRRQAKLAEIEAISF